MFSLNQSAPDATQTRSNTQPLRVVVLGRPNVGKSTLFNRLLGYRKAIVHDLPGVTRDRVVSQTIWYLPEGAIWIELCDTGGVGEGPFKEEIARQVQIALSDADVGIMVVDGRLGIVGEDRELVQHLRQRGVLEKVPLILAVNKLDVDAHEQGLFEFAELSVGSSILPISAEHGRGMHDLQRAVVRLVSEETLKRSIAPQESAEEAEARQDPTHEETGEGAHDEAHDETDNKTLATSLAEEIRHRAGRKKGGHQALPRVAVVGKPNVGKSTLINFLLREERMIVSPIAGTTVDPIDSLVKMGEHEFILVDTAGVRRKSKTEKGVEVLSIVQTRKALETADVALLVIDAEVGPTDQDEKIASLIEEAGASVIVLVNKWDLRRQVSKSLGREFHAADALEVLRKEMSFLHYAPIQLMSAKTGYGVDELGALIARVLQERTVKIPTKEFTEWVKAQWDEINPYKLKFYYGHQTGSHPPTFACRVNDPERVHFSFKRQVLRNLRKTYGYTGTPVRLHFLKSN